MNLTFFRLIPGPPALLGLFLITASMLTPSPAAGADPLIVFDDYPPYHYWDRGNPAGLNIDMLNEAFSRLGVTPTFERRPWKRSLDELARGDVTGLCAGFKTPAREKIAFFPTRELSAETNWIISLKDRGLHSTRLKDLTGLVVGVVEEYSYGEEFDTRKELKLNRSASDTQLLNKLLGGRVDVIVGNDLVIRHLASQRHKLDLLKFHFPVNTDPTYLLLSRSDPANAVLARDLSEVLLSMRTDGTYRRILKGYRGDLDVDIYAVATEVWPPFRFTDGRGYLTGIDKDLLDVIGRRMGARFVWHQRPWARCLMEIKEGKADITTGVARTPERERYTLFTDRSYFTSAPAFYLADEDRAKGLRTYDDLRRLSIGYSRGSAYFKRFDEDKTLDKRIGANEKQLIRMVMESRWDAFIGTDSQVDYDLARMGLTHRVFKAPYKPKSPIRLRLGVSRKSPLAKRMDELNRVLDTILVDGTLDRLRTKYFGSASHAGPASR